MKVLHFGSNYLPSRGGNVVRMTNMLENNNTDTEIFIMTTTPRKDFDDEEYYDKTGIHIFRIDSLEQAKRELPRVTQEYQIDIVVTHIIPANMIACRVLPKNVLIMTEVHSLIDSGTIKNRLKDLLHRFWLNRRTNKYFVLSQGAAKYIKKHYGVRQENIVFLPNGYNGKLTAGSAGNKDYFTFGYVGTFYSWQGIDMIADNVDRILSIDVVANQYHDFDEFLSEVDMVVIMVKHNEIKDNVEKLNGKVVLDCHNIIKLSGVYHI